MATAAMLAGINRPALAGQLTVKATHGSGLCNMAIFLAHARKMTEPYGINLEFVNAPASADIAAIFGSGQVDLSSIPYSNFFTLIDTLAPSYVQVARIMGASRLQIFIQVILPAILPGLFVVLRLNLFAAWMIVLIAESVGVGGGLGLVVIISRNTFDAQLAFFTMFIIGGVGFVLDAALRGIQRRALYWQP